MEDYIVLKVENGAVSMTPNEINEAIASGTLVVLCYNNDVHDVYYYPYSFTSDFEFMFVYLYDPFEYKLFVNGDKTVDVD